MTVAREAWVFVLPVALLAAGAVLLQWPRTALAMGALAVLVLAFFRIPHRSSNADSNLLLAPANGTVTAIESVEEPLLGGRRHTRVTTFLSVFNVHVQRAPAAGRVTMSRFSPGRKLAAFRPAAGEVNESHFVSLETASGAVIGVKQIAGLVARRIVSYLEPGQEVERGQLIGLIKFGSRVDLYLPEGYEVLVAKGDRVVEGLTPIARPTSPIDGQGARQP